MEDMQILHMNKGEREASYANNCSVQLNEHGGMKWLNCMQSQRQIISFGNTILEAAVAESIQNTLPKSMGIADLGCSSGPNTLLVVSQIIDTVYAASYDAGLPLPELRVSLNDLPANDFNQIFKSLPHFYTNLRKEKGVGLDGCFISAMPGSFYGRLFPANTLHFVHSSSSLHWLSKVPAGMDSDENKGKIYISKTSSERVVKAYLSQFEKDFWVFLRSRAEEMVAGGTMVLSFMGRTSPYAAAEVGTHQWELLAQALSIMAKHQGDGVLEGKIKWFNAPYYAPSPEEVRNITEEEGSFIINQLQAFEIGWDGDHPKHHFQLQEANQVANTIRAVVEPMLELHFGTQIMDELFRIYAQLLQHYFSTTIAKHINLVIYLTRKF